MAVWTVKGGQQGEREDRFLQHGLIGLGLDNVPDLTGVTSVDEVATRYAAAYPADGKLRAANYTGQLWSLVHRMHEGDLVVLPLKTTGTIAVGRVDGPYAYRIDLGEGLRHVRSVRWDARDAPRDAFDQDLLYSFGAFITIGQVRRDRAEERILAAIRREPSSTAEAVAVSVPVAEVEERPNVGALASEETRRYVSTQFVGHALTTLVAAVLEAQGFRSLYVSPPGPDEGVDILAGSGSLGLDSPRVAVQVKTGQAGVDELRTLRGVLETFQADQGLLVAWGGFKGTLRQEAHRSHFVVRLWDADELLANIYAVYERLPADVRTQLPLTRVWALVTPSE